MLEKTTNKMGRKSVGMVRGQARRGLKGLMKMIVVAPLQKLGKLFKNFFAGRLSPRAHWTAEILMVTLICALFAWINWNYRLDRFLSGPLFVRQFWLGIVLFLIYLVGRLTHLVIRLRPRAVGTFKDIRLADVDEFDAAAEARIDLQDSPLFLVLGADPEIEKAMNTSSFVGERVKVDDPDLPVHWHGDADAMWVSVPGISGISAQRAHLEKYQQLAKKPGAKPQSMRVDAAVRERVYQRMLYAVGMLEKLRRPVVPVNGIVVLVPYSWIANEEYAPLVDTIKLDMAAIQNALGVKCMCVVLFHEIERNRDFLGYLRRIPEAALQRRCGCTLPAFTPPAEADYDQLHTWLFRFFRQQIYGMFRATRESELNPGLVRFLNAFKKHQKRFTHALSNVFPTDFPDHLYLSGVYFVHLRKGDRTFFDGVAAKLASDHDEMIGWTEPRQRRERRMSRTASMLAAGAVALVIFDAFMMTRFLMSW